MNKANADIKKESKEWFYSKEVKEHFFHPKNFMRDGDESKYSADGVGMVGSPACGDMMLVWIKLDKKKERIKDIKWRTFGCASAIASTSMLSVMIKENGGMRIEDALNIKPQDISQRLGGLPTIKFHCSVLGDKALRAAINNYYEKSGKKDKTIVEGNKIVDKETNTTEGDIEEAVIEGHDTLEKIQAKLKVGISNKECIPEVEQLIRFYKEKYGVR